MNDETTPPTSVHGVQALLDKLRQDGVEAGQTEAEQLVAAARVQAMEILDQAQAQAAEILVAARQAAAQYEANGREALRLASRDVVLTVREACHEEFRNRLSRFVAHRLADQKLLEQMILELTARSRPSDDRQRWQVLLPQTHATAEELRREVREVQPGSLTAFVLGLTGDLLREGLTFAVSPDPGAGVRIKLLDDDVQLELTEHTITSVLMQYLAPRYRAVMEQDG
jgi:V/A-type H+-transporting ATPase subunit E